MEFPESQPPHLRHLQTNTTPTRSYNYNSSSTNKVITWILVVCVILPFLVASFLQCIFCFRQKRRRRREAALEEVNANPGGRRMILELLFKENVSEVQGGDLDEGGMKKKRVLVKKRRKKTEEERKKKNEGDGENRINVGGEKKVSKWPGASWWGEERVRSSTVSDDERIVICVSSDGLEVDMDNIIGAASGKSASIDVVDTKEDVRDDRPQVIGEDGDEENGMPIGDTAEQQEDISEQEDVTESLSVNSHEAIADDNISEGEESLSQSSDHLVPEERACGDVQDIISVGTVGDNNKQAGSKSGDKDAIGKNDHHGNSFQHIQCGAETPSAANGNQNEAGVSQNTSSSPIPCLDKEEFKNMTVQLAPRIGSQRLVDNRTNGAQVLEPPHREVGGPNDISPLSPCFENGEDALSRTSGAPTSSFGLVIPDISCCDDTDDDNSNNGIATEKSMASPPSIFRTRDQEMPSDLEIQQCMSTDTELASNVDELSKSDNYSSKILPKLSSADIVPSYKLNRTESYKTDGSSISYFSYEDVSIEDEDAEMCAVCICPYEEGDVRIFSKHCSHVFHKDCIFEWLVKGHNECPCCRTDMVTKSEIKETSASLIGTEQLTEAMRNAMVEAPPFRRRPRLPRHMIARARQMRQASTQLHDGATMPAQSPNAHRLWSARHQMPNSGFAPAQTNASSPSVASPPPHNNSANTHNNDWLWTARFENMASQGISPVPMRTRSSDSIDDNRPSSNVLASRSSDAIDTNRPSGNALASRSSDAVLGSEAPTEQPTLHHHATAGSLLLGQNLHPNWSFSHTNISRPRAQTLALSPTSRRHPHWSQRSNRRDSRGVDAPLIEIPARPAVAPIGSDGVSDA